MVFFGALPKPNSLQFSPFCFFVLIWVLRILLLLECTLGSTGFWIKMWNSALFLFCFFFLLFLFYMETFSFNILLEMYNKYTFEIIFIYIWHFERNQHAVCVLIQQYEMREHLMGLCVKKNQYYEAHSSSASHYWTNLFRNYFRLSK